MIPENRMSAEALRPLLERLPMKSRTYGVDVSENITTDECMDVFRQLLATDRHMTVALRFMLGDVYNQIPKTPGAKNAILAPIYAEFGSKYRQLLKTFGWTARKWREEKRSAEYPWSWWVNHYLDEHDVVQEHKPRDGGIVKLEVCSEQRHANGDTVFFAEHGGKRYALYVPHKNGHTTYTRTSNSPDCNAGYATEKQAEEFETA